MHQLWSPPGNDTKLGLTIGMAIVLYQCAVGPFLSRNWFKAATESIAENPAARIGAYQKMIRRQVVRIALVAAAILLVPISVRSMGFVHTRVPHGSSWLSEGNGHSPISVDTQLSTFVGFAILLIAQLLVIANLSRVPKLLQHLLPLFPRTLSQRGWWTLVSIGAGVSEELFFRGALPVILLALVPSLGISGAVIVQAILFGGCHLYQGRIGMLGTTLAGLLLGSLVTLTGTLWLAIAVHVLVDARFALIPRFKAQLAVGSDR